MYSCKVKSLFLIELNIKPKYRKKHLNFLKTKKTGCITAAGPQKKLESYKKIKLFRCYKCLPLPGHPYLLCGIGQSFCEAGVGFRI